nr:hypothetical protein [Streptomyces sp. NRRL F-2664]
MKRRSDVVQAFPDTAAASRPATAAIVELHDEWTPSPAATPPPKAWTASTQTPKPTCPTPQNDQLHHDQGHDPGPSRCLLRSRYSGAAATG